MLGAAAEFASKKLRRPQKRVLLGTCYEAVATLDVPIPSARGDVTSSGDDDGVHVGLHVERLRPMVGAACAR